MVICLKHCLLIVFRFYQEQFFFCYATIIDELEDLICMSSYGTLEKTMASSSNQGHTYPHSRGNDLTQRVSNTGVSKEANDKTKTTPCVIQPMCENSEFETSEGFCQVRKRAREDSEVRRPNSL